MRMDFDIISVNDVKNVNWILYNAGGNGNSARFNLNWFIEDFWITEITVFVSYKKRGNLYIKDTGFVKEMKLQPGNRLVDSKGSVLVVEEKAWDNGWTCEGSQLSKTTFENLDL